jgi:DNA-binding beta-propeller fold protein YncE
MDSGVVLVCDEGTGRLLGYDANHTLLGGIFGGDPTLSNPRGTAFTPDGSTIWVISRNGFVQRWERIANVKGWMVY